MSETSIAVAKAISAAALLYLLYVAVTCPCRPELYKCHLTEIYAAIFVFVAVLVYYNGFRLKSYV